MSWLSETDSTNSRLADEARSGDLSERVLVAEHQTAGRGRLDRRWEDTPGSSLLFSVLVSEGLEARSRPLVGLAMGVAVTAVLGGAGADVGLKWPNDVVVPSRDLGKICGVLAESVGESAVVVGAGVNVAPDPSRPPEAVHLSELVNPCPERVDLLVAVLGAFAAELDRVAAGRDEFLARYRELCLTVGSEVRAELAGRTVVGRASGIDDGGALVIETSDGPQVVNAGDVVHLRDRAL